MIKRVKKYWCLFLIQINLCVLANQISTDLFKNFEPLETERLIIRRLTVADIHDCFVITSDPRVLKMMAATPLHTTIEHTKKYINEIIDHYEQNKADLWAVVEKSSNRMIGLCGFLEYKENYRRAELGYAFAYNQWGKGYATESCTAIIQYGFRCMHLQRIEANVDPENKSSIHVLEKLGMKFEGVMRQRVICNNKPCDRSMFGLLRK